MAVVVDTNVAMVASGHSTQADAACIDACVQRLAEIVQHGVLLVDDLGLVFTEYTKRLGFAGQPGAGEKFVKWAFSNQSTPGAVRTVAITPRSGAGWRRFEEFPDRADLSGFDRSDQKFVAVAVASGDEPPILHATDRGWWRHRDALNAAGVRVESLCPQHAPGS